MSISTGLQYNRFILLIILLSAAVFSSFTAFANLGTFQIKIVSLDFESASTSHKMDLDESPKGDGKFLPCSNSSLAIKACLSHHQLPLPRIVQCTLGEADRDWLLSRQGLLTSESVLSLPFAFAWPGAFTLSLSAVKRCHSNKEEDVQLSSLVVADYISPSQRWTLVIKSTGSDGPIRKRSTAHIDHLPSRRTVDHRRLGKRGLHRVIRQDTNVHTDTDRRKNRNLNIGNVYRPSNVKDITDSAGESVRAIDKNARLQLEKNLKMTAGHVFHIRENSEKHTLGATSDSLHTESLATDTAGHVFHTRENSKKHTLGAKSDSLHMESSATDAAVPSSRANFQTAPFPSDQHSKTDSPDHHAARSPRGMSALQALPTHSKSTTTYLGLENYLHKLNSPQQISTQSSDQSLAEPQRAHSNRFRIETLSEFLKQVKRRRSVSGPGFYPSDAENSEMKTTEDGEETHSRSDEEGSNGWTDENTDFLVSREAVVRTHGAEMEVAVRVVCRENYYGDSCSEFCRPRDDLLGHYTCDRLGQRVCLAGWEGPECTEAICSKLCIPSRGTCTRPDTCSCRHGWFGEHCDKCRTYPGCVHGTCHLPGQCVCLKGWAGPLCDVELLFCQHHNPCQNGATCYHDNSHNYTCGCPAGYTGAHCEVSECHAHFCMNGGSCKVAEGTRYCLCPPHFAGPRCQHRTPQQISSVPCDGPACYHQTDSYRLECAGPDCLKEHPPCQRPPCSPRTQVPPHKPCVGELCSETNLKRERPMNRCQRHLCYNNGRCTEQDNLTTPVCKCPFPFTGAHCLQVLNASCTTNPCLNNGVCTTAESSRAFYCSCGPKHTGKLCEIKISIFTNETTFCDRDGQGDGKMAGGVVCHNGGKCEKSRRGGRFYCKCGGGFTGEFCEIDNSNPCLVHKCLHGGTCSVGGNNTPVCACPAGYTGVSCHVHVEPWCRRVMCQNGGSCIDHDSSFTCACKGGYEGRYCENAVMARKTIRVEIKTSMNVCCDATSVRLAFWDVILLSTVYVIVRSLSAYQ